MPWSRIVLDDGYESRACDWLRAIFRHVFNEASSSLHAELGLYVTRRTAGPVVLYFTPVATQRMRSAAASFVLADCAMPAMETVELVHDSPIAGSDPWHVEDAA